MHDVVVIGAGYAGLSAAVELSARGARVLVLEAKPQLGGRATAFLDRVTGEFVDNGQHVLFGCCRHTFRFLSRIGSDQNVHLQPNLDVALVDRSGYRIRLRCASAPAPLNLFGALLNFDGVSFRDRLSALRIIRPVQLAKRQARGDRNSIASSPNETVESWLIRNGQTPRLRQLLWEPLALAVLNQYPSYAAAPTFVRVLAELFSSDSRDAVIGMPALPLNKLYAEPAREFIEEHGGEVRVGASAYVLVNEYVVQGVTVRGEKISSGAVVSAVPWFSLSSLLPDLSEIPTSFVPTVTSANSMFSSPIVTVNLWFDRSVMDVPFIGFPGRIMQWAFDKRFACDSNTTRLALISSGADEIVGRSNDALISMAMKELSDALPDTKLANLIHATVMRERRATFSLAPGQPTRPDTRTPISGFYLAGDWINTGLPGTIESAVKSGHWAAEAVLEDLSVES